MELRIDPEFEGQIPALSEDEFRQLEENILAEGVIINPLIVWNGVIVDGHNRFRIAQKHPEITYTTREKEFADRFEANVWICKNQLGRRNLTPEQKKYLIGKQYEAEKSCHGGDRKSTEAKSSAAKRHLNSKPKTCDRIAEENGVGRTYVKEAERYAKGVDAAEEVVPGIRQEILSGKIHPTAQAVAAVADAPVEERPQLAKQLRKKKDSKNRTVENENCDLDDLQKSPAQKNPDFKSQEYRNSQKSENDAIIKRVPTLQEIREISAGMETSRTEGNLEDVLCELEDAVDTMIDRWNICRQIYQGEFEKKSSLKCIRKLAERGIQFLQQIEGGPK
jgi:ParB-like chromosome segregation protein Spo0J